jgi:hypothetical protein
MTDEYPPKKPRSWEDWETYWAGQRWDRRARRRLRIRLAPWRRRIGFPKRWRTEVKVFLQRGRRGWSASDVWSMDDYICTLLGQMTAELRAKAHGHPCMATETSACGGMPDSPPCNCEQAWNETLDAISAPLLAYRTHWDFTEGESSDQHWQREKRIIAEAQDALRLLADHLPAMWD